MVDSGFEPLKAEPADLQSAPIGRSGNLPLRDLRSRKNTSEDLGREIRLDRKSTRLNSSHTDISRMPSSA